jgi:phage gp45-like
MEYGSTSEVGDRAYSGLVRGHVKKIDDSKLMQAGDIRGQFGEFPTDVERWQNYGFSSVVHPEDEKTGVSAEMLAMSMTGARSHRAVVVVDDRRHRLYNLKEGETAQFDDQGQRLHLQRDKALLTSPKAISIQTAQAKQQQNQGQGQGQGQSSQSGGKKYGQDAKQEHERKGWLDIDKDGNITIGNGKATITISKDGVITAKGTKIVTDGKTYLGSPNASKEASMRGTIDTHGDAEVSNLATKVFVV